MMHLMISNMKVSENLLSNEKYKYLFSVEEVNKLVLRGMPFRDAYKKVGLEIEEGHFTYSTTVHHTHEGSIGNLQTEQVKKQMEKIVSSFPFASVQTAITKLIS